MVEPRFVQPQPPYFLIKIGKEYQKDRKEKEGNFYVPQEYAFMKRGCQFGEIVSIGEGAAKYMPMAEVGDYLLIHHMIEGKKDERGYNFYLVDEDDEFNYYVVNAYELPGERVMSYAVAKGSEIIPTPDYIFLECSQTEQDKDLMQTEVSKNGLIVPKERTKSREEWIAIMQANKKRCELLANIIPTTPMEEIFILQDPAKKERHDFAVKEIKMLEAENLRISKFINKKRYEPYVVAAINPDWSSSVKKITGEDIQVGDTIFMLNIACQTKIDFSGTEFIVAQTQYFGISENQLRTDIKNYTDGIKLHSSPTKKRSNKVRG